MTTNNPQPGNTHQRADSPVRADLVFIPPELGRTLVRLIEHPTDRAEADPDYQDGNDE